MKYKLYIYNKYGYLMSKSQPSGWTNIIAMVRDQDWEFDGLVVRKEHFKGMVRQEHDPYPLIWVEDYRSFYDDDY